MKKRLAIITTHPIQYNAPLFALLSSRKNIDVKVFYTWGESVLNNKYDPGFGKNIKWDIPLLNGYECSFIENVSTDPGSHHFKGIDNPSLITDIEKWKADSILIYGWAFKSHLRAMRYFHRRIPVFFRGDSTLLGRKENLKSMVRKYFLKWVYSHVDSAFYVGENNKDYYLQNGLNQAQLIFAPHAVDNKRFEDDKGIYRQQADEWRSKLGIQIGDLVLIYAGKLEAIKNVGWLIESLKEAKDITIKILIVGNGPLEKKLKEKTSGDSRIIFIDFQNQQLMPVVYRLGEIFILCSVSETWGLSVNEAMACGRAIIVSDTCGCAKDLVEDGINGYIIPSNNKEILLSTLRKIDTERKLLSQMKNASLKKISNYSLEAIAMTIEKSLQAADDLNDLSKK